MKNWIAILIALIALNSYRQNQEPKELGIEFAIAINSSKWGIS